MSKKIIGVLIIFLSIKAAEAQVVPVTDSQADTVYKKVLLIPYQPMMHLSDADHDIAEFMDLTNEQVRAAFRSGLCRQVTTQIMKVYPMVSMLAGASDELTNDLDMIYGSVSYSMDTVFQVSHPAIDTTKKKFFFSKKQTSKINEVHDLTFMNTRLSHPALLGKLAETYGTDLFVFLNQFEIITNYDDCLDFALKIYRRQLKVHYSIFDVNGKELYGDVAVVDFPSNSNDSREIMLKNFPKISESIARNIPRKKVFAAAELPEVTEKRH